MPSSYLKSLVREQGPTPRTYPLSPNGGTVGGATPHKDRRVGVATPGDLSMWKVLVRAPTERAVHPYTFRSPP